MPSCVGHTTKFTSSQEATFSLLMESEYWTKKHVVKAVWPFKVNKFVSCTFLQVGPTLRGMVPALKSL